MAITITCPHCSRALRANARPPEGKKVKCPGCEMLFLPEVNGEGEGIQAAPRIKAKAKTALNRNSRADEDEGSDDDAERPIKKKRPKKKSKTMLFAILGLLVGGGGCATACCGGLAVALFVWPGWLLSKNELLAFVAPDADLIVAGNLKMMRDKSTDFEKSIREQLADNKALIKDSQDLVDLTANGEQILFYMNTRDKTPKVVILIQGRAADVDKFKKNPALGTAQTVGGHPEVYKPKQDPGKSNLPKYVAFPGNQIVVLAELEEADMKALLDRGKKPAPAIEVVELGKTVQKMPFWVAFSVNAERRSELKKFVEMSGKKVPALNAAVPAIDNVKGLTVSMDVMGNQDVKIETSVHCKTGEDATKIKAGVEEAWNTFKGLINLADMMPIGPPGQAKIPPTLVQDMNSMAFKTQGPVAIASLQISAATTNELKKNMPAKK